MERHEWLPHLYALRAEFAAIAASESVSCRYTIDYGTRADITMDLNYPDDEIWPEAVPTIRSVRYEGLGSERMSNAARQAEMYTRLAFPKLMEGLRIGASIVRPWEHLVYRTAVPEPDGWEASEQGVPDIILPKVAEHSALIVSILITVLVREATNVIHEGTNVESGGYLGLKLSDTALERDGFAEELVLLTRRSAELLQIIMTAGEVGIDRPKVMRELYGAIRKSDPALDAVCKTLNGQIHQFKVKVYKDKGTWTLREIK
ncbi:MAG: hypothetical protein FJ276_37080 [Planctomycetes bacterium]|nr:hypothetical protein [Planctomycetota bacterium]